MPNRNANFTRFAWATLALNVAVILWGAYVRATGSGAGCGSHWPTCNGEVIPRAPQVATLIEYTHRLTSGLAFLAVLSLSFFAFYRFPRGHRVRFWAALSMGSMLVEAMIGAVIVLKGLVGSDASVARAFIMGVHLINTFVLLMALTMVALASEHPSP
ncbi:MAG: COX15/CtaA family protein, partial [Deltaproteobacteria bacterium]|nr:COX15/CtaA family protein [Deltaproteobacteria bacterium]